MNQVESFLIENHRVKSKQMKKEIFGRQLCIATTILCIFLYLFDTYTDIAQGITYLKNGDGWHGAITLALVIVPALFNSIYTAVVHYANNGVYIHKLPIPSLLVYPLCIILHGQLSRLLVWIYFLRSNSLCFKIAKELTMINRDLVFFTEIFIESIPQLYLQLYVMIVTKGEYTSLQILTCISSVFAASWGVLALFKGFRNKLLAFQMSLFWFSSRIAAMAILASYNKKAPFILLTIHLVCVAPLWFYEIKKRPFQRRPNSEINGWQMVITDSFYAILYAVCNTATPIASAYYFPLSIVFCLQNFACYICAYYKGKLHGRNLPTYPSSTIDFKDWHYAIPLIITCGVLTLVVFLQCCVIYILKYRKIIRKDIFDSHIMTLITTISRSRNQLHIDLSNSPSNNLETRNTSRSLTRDV